MEKKRAILMVKEQFDETIEVIQQAATESRIKESVCLVRERWPLIERKAGKR